MMSSPCWRVVRGGTALTMDGAATVIEDAEVWIRDGRIVALGRTGSAAPQPGPAAGETVEVVEARHGFVLPGFVQGHVHLGQTLFRGLAEDRPLLAWLRERIWPLEAAHDEESAYWSGRLGAAECLLGGTTTIQDIGLGPGIGGLLEAIADSGLRAVAGRCLMDGGEGMPPGLAGATADELRSTEELGLAFPRRGPAGRLRWVLNPRFILSCSDALWRGIRDLASRHGWPVHTHALEQLPETEAVRAIKGGRDEVEYFAEEGVLDADLRLAHGVWIEERHRPRLAAAGCSVVHCPGSNLKLGSGIADVVGLRAAGIAVGLGADGAACNNDLDALEEARLAAALAAVRRRPGALPAIDALRLLTSEGARALGLEAEIGSLEVGKRADLVVLDRGLRPEMWAGAGVDPHVVVVHSASRATVRHVLVDGEDRVRDGALVGPAAESGLGGILDRATRALDELLDRARIPGLEPGRGGRGTLD